MERKGSAFLREPKNEDWGAQTFDVLDPSGNTTFVIGQSRRTNPLANLILSLV
jgi:hypothetical protein